MEELVLLANEKTLNEIEQEALIQRFEYTQELAWLVIKDFFESVEKLVYKEVVMLSN